jgi:hypothetical protein
MKNMRDGGDYVQTDRCIRLLLRIASFVANFGWSCDAIEPPILVSNKLS